MIEVKDKVGNVLAYASAIADEWEDKGYSPRVLYLAAIELLARADVERAGELLEIVDENIVQCIPRRQKCRKRRR